MRLVEGKEPELVDEVAEAFTHVEPVGVSSSQSGEASCGIKGKPIIGTGVDLVSGPVLGGGGSQGRVQGLSHSGEVETKTSWEAPAQRVGRVFDLEVRVPGKPPCDSATPCAPPSDERSGPV